MEQVDLCRRVKADAAQRLKGFTLVELLTVMAVIAVLLALVVPAFTNISQGTDLTRTGQDFADTLTLARDEALSRNRKVLVCLIQEAAPSASSTALYRAVQLLVVKDDAGNTAPLGKALQFPNRVVLAGDPSAGPSVLSPMPLQAPAPSTPLPAKLTVAGASCNYKYFTINANGILDAANAGASGSANGSGGNSTNTFLTLVQEKDVNAAAAPANFFSVYINPVTGEYSTFRP